MTKQQFHPLMVERWEMAACAGKERFSDGSKAHRALGHVKANKSKPMVFRCVHCGGWHLGRRK